MNLKSKDIKAIALDIDGTLRSSEGIIMPKTKQALIDLQKQGIHVILASGRPTPGMMNLAHELEMDKYHGLIVSYNGAMAIDFTSKEVLFKQCMDVETCKEVLKHMENFDVIPMIDDGEYMYVENVYNRVAAAPPGYSENTIDHEAHGNNFLLCEAKSLTEYCDWELPKILTAGTPEYLAANREAMYEPFKGKLNAMMTSAIYFEFTDMGVDKTKALGYALEKIGLTKDNLIAFGDGENDLTMLKMAEIGVAMGNAGDIVKEAADVVSTSNNEEGIYNILKEVFEV